MFSDSTTLPPRNSKPMPPETKPVLLRKHASAPLALQHTHAASIKNPTISADTANIVFIPVVYFLYPETANRTLEDLDDYFDKSSPHKTIIRIGDKVAKQHHRPTEAIEAERRRIETTNLNEYGTAKDSSKQFVEHVEVAGK